MLVFQKPDNLHPNMQKITNHLATTVKITVASQLASMILDSTTPQKIRVHSKSTPYSIVHLHYHIYNSPFSTTGIAPACELKSIATTCWVQVNRCSSPGIPQGLPKVEPTFPQASHILLIQPGLLMGVVWEVYRNGGHLWESLQFLSKQCVPIPNMASRPGASHHRKYPCYHFDHTKPIMITHHPLPPTALPWQRSLRYSPASSAAIEVPDHDGKSHFWPPVARRFFSTKLPCWDEVLKLHSGWAVWLGPHRVLLRPKQQKPSTERTSSRISRLFRIEFTKLTSRFGDFFGMIPLPTHVEDHPFLVHLSKGLPRTFRWFEDRIPTKILGTSCLNS